MFYMLNAATHEMAIDSRIQRSTIAGGLPRLDFSKLSQSSSSVVDATTIVVAKFPGTKGCVHVAVLERLKVTRRDI